MMTAEEKQMLFNALEMSKDISVVGILDIDEESVIDIAYFPVKRMRVMRITKHEAESKIAQYKLITKK